MNRLDPEGAFHRAYFGDRLHRRTDFVGVEVVKAVTDLWAYQELLTELRPTVIVEFGVWAGGFLLYLDWLCEALQLEARILGVDVEVRRLNASVRDRPRITILQAASLSPAAEEAVRRLRHEAPGPMLVAVDDDHHAPHVLDELRMLRPLTRADDMVVVEDTNISQVRPQFGPGPAEAIRAYFEQYPNDYEVDDRFDGKFGLTYAAGGWLRRRPCESS